MQTNINPLKQNNGHGRIMRRVQFRSSFKEKEPSLMAVDTDCVGEKQPLLI